MNIEINLYKYFKVWDSFTIPSIYSNTMSFYETCSKLIVELNKLRDNQNISSENIDLISKNFPFLLNNLTSLINDYISKIETEWNNFNQATDKKYQYYITNLLTNVNTFKNTIETTTNNFLSELENTFNGYKVQLQNTTNLGLKPLQDIYDKLFNTLGQNGTLYNEFITDLEELKNKYEDLKNQINNWLSDMTNMINNEYTKMDNRLNAYDIQMSYIPDNYITKPYMNETIQAYALLNPNIFKKNNPLYQYVKYYGENTPTNPSENDYWINGNQLLIYNNSEWINTSSDKLLITESNRVFYTSWVQSQIITRTLLRPTNNLDYPWNLVGIRRVNNKFNLVFIQTENTRWINEETLQLEEHTRTYCDANRGWGSADLTRNNYNENYRHNRMSYLRDGSVYAKIGYYFYTGVTKDGIKYPFPNPNANTCEEVVSPKLWNSKSGWYLITDRQEFEYPLLSSTNNTWGNYYIYYEDGTYLFTQSYMPMFIYNNVMYVMYEYPENSNNGTHWRTYTFNEETGKFNTSYNNKNTTQEKFNGLQIDYNKKYIYTVDSVWRVEDFIDRITGAYITDVPMPTPLFKASSEIVGTMSNSYVEGDYFYIGGIKEKGYTSVNLLTGETFHVNHPTDINSNHEFEPYGDGWFYSTINLPDTQGTEIKMFKISQGVNEISYVPISSSTN